MNSTHSPQSCSQCLYDSRHPLGLQFDNMGICSGCRTHREKFELDWEYRWVLLQETIDRYRGDSSQGETYDCVIPVRGTPEYFYLVHLVVEELGLRPLLAVYNSQLNSVVGVKNLARIVERFGLDSEALSLRPSLYKNLVRESLQRFGTVRWPFLAGEAKFAFQLANEYRIPLVIWPYSDAVEQVGAHSYSELPEYSFHGLVNWDLSGVSPENLFREASVSLAPESSRYLPARDDFSIQVARGIFMANFVPWDSRAFAEHAVRNFGALGCSTPRSFDTYDKVDDVAYMRTHDLLKLGKFGYSRVRDQLVREIRFGRISREVAVELENYFASELVSEQSLHGFAEWLGTTPESLDWIVRYWQGRKGFDGFRQVGSPRPAQLSDEASEFVASYISHGTDLSSKPLLYAKGLELSEKL